MSNVNEMSNLGNFFDRLSKKQKPASKDDTPKLKVIALNYGPKYGTIKFLPFLDANYGPVVLIDDDEGRMREISIWRDVDSSEDGGWDAWYHVLPLSYYDNLTQDEIDLYNRVVSKFDYARDSGGDNGAGLYDYQSLRTKCYGLFYGYALQYFNTENKSQDNFTAGPALIVIPNRTVGFTLKTDMEKWDSYGSTAWRNKIYNNNLTGRDGWLEVSLVPRVDGGVGNNLTINHAVANPNMPQANAVGPDLVISDDVLKMFSVSILRSFLGWEAGKDKLFDAENFKKIEFDLDQKIVAIKAALEPTTNASTAEVTGVTPVVNTNTAVVDVQNLVPANGQIVMKAPPVG